MPLKLDLTVAAIAEDSGRFLFVQERAARRVGERDGSLALDRAILRTLWLDRGELERRAAERRSPLEDFLRGARYPLDPLNQVPLGGLALRQAAG